MGLGVKSFEDEEGIEFAPRQSLGFDCAKEHHFEVTFAHDAELPTEWECPKCGATALRSDGTDPGAKDSKPPRTHWDMLSERRTTEELEELLNERLEVVRQSVRY
jgi:rubredoxin